MILRVSMIVSYSHDCVFDLSAVVLLGMPKLLEYVIRLEHAISVWKDSSNRNIDG